MRQLKKVILYFLLLHFIQGIYGYLYPDNNWPTSFKNFYFREYRNEIKNMFEDGYIKLRFNKGSKSGSKYNPINMKWHDKILDDLKEHTNKALQEAVEQIKNCPAFNKLFGEAAKKNLQKIKNTIGFCSFDADGTIDHVWLRVKLEYLGNFIFHCGKQAREIENGQRTDFDLTTDHFNINIWGDIDKNSITETIAHEFMHVLSGWNSGRQMAECIVHCLSKKCSDPDHDFRELDVPTVGQHTAPIDCHKIQEKDWKGKDDIADEMDAGDCFCGLKWVENADCDEPATTSTAGKEKEGDAPDDHYSFNRNQKKPKNLLTNSRIAGTLFCPVQAIKCSVQKRTVNQDVFQVQT